MHHFRQTLAAGLLALLSALVTALPVQAATWRYSFDVVSSQIDFEDLAKYDSPEYVATPYHQVPITPEEEAYIIGQYHPLGSLRGVTGSNVIEIVEERRTPGVWYLDVDITCISGFLCPYLMNAHTDPSGFLDGDFVGMSSYFLSFGPSGYGSLGTIGNMSIQGSPEIDGYYYDFWYARAAFDLTNASRVDISQVPLPAGSVLLLSGLTLLVLRRRKS